MFWKLLIAIPLALLPIAASAADISGVPRIREGDQVQIGNTRIRLGGIDAPSADQLCLNTKGERWDCGTSTRNPGFAICVRPTAVAERSRDAMSTVKTFRNGW